MSKLLENGLEGDPSEPRRHPTSLLGGSISDSPTLPQHTQSHAHNSETKPFRSRITDTTSSFHSPLASPLPTQALLHDADVPLLVPSSPSALSPPPSAPTPLPASTLDVTSLPPPSPSSAPAPAFASAASPPSTDATKSAFYYFKYSAAYLACIFFGMTAWLPVNSLYSELPQFSNTQPEAQTLSSYLIAAQQVGNIIFFIFLHFCGGALFRSPLLMRAAVLVFLCLNVFVLLLAAFAWDTTTGIAGGQRSIVIYIGMMIAGFSSATSNVFFFPIVSEFPQSFTNAYSIGLGAASALAGGGALVQDAGASVLRFSVQTFFGALAGIACASVCAFAFLCWHPWAVALRNDYRAGGTGDAGAAPQQVPFFPLATLLLRGVVVSGVETSSVYQDDSVLPASRDPLYTHSRVSLDADRHCDVLLPSGALLVMDRWREPTRVHAHEAAASHAALARPSLSAAGGADACDATGDYHDARATADGQRGDSDGEDAEDAEDDAGARASVRTRRSGEPWYRQSVTVPLPLPSKPTLFWHGRGYFLSICVVALMNFGLHQSFLPYACFNYQSSKRVYLWGSSVLFIVDPCMRLLLSFPAVARRCCRRWVLYCAAAVVVLAECLIIALAAQSPFPWGWRRPSMGVLPVFLSGLVGVGYALVSTCVFLMMYGESEPACRAVANAHVEEEEEVEAEAEGLREQRAVEEQDTLLAMEASTTTTGSGSAAAFASAQSSPAAAATICDLSLPSLRAVFLSQVLRSQYLHPANHAHPADNAHPANHAHRAGESGDSADALRQQVRLHQALLVWARDEARRLRDAEEEWRRERRTGEESDEGDAHGRTLPRARLLRVGYEDIVRHYARAAERASFIRKNKKSERAGRPDMKRATSFADHSVVRASVTRARNDDAASSDGSDSGEDVCAAVGTHNAAAAAVLAAPLATTASAATPTAPAALASVHAPSRPPSLAPSLAPSFASSRVAAPVSPRTRPARSERGGARRASVTGYATAAEGEGVCYWDAHADATAAPSPDAAAIVPAAPPLVTASATAEPALARAEYVSHAPSVKSAYSGKTAFSGESVSSGFLDRFEDTASMIQRVRRESLLAKQQQHATEAAVPPHRLPARQRLQLLAAQPYQTVSVRRQESPSAVCGDASFYSPPTQHDTATTATTMLSSAPSLPLSLARGSAYGATEDARDTNPSQPPLSMPTPAPAATTHPRRSRPIRATCPPTASASADTQVDRYLARKAQLRVTITTPVLLSRPRKASDTRADATVAVAGEPVSASVPRSAAETRVLEDREVEVEEVEDMRDEHEADEERRMGYGAARRSSQASVWSNAPRRNSLGDLPAPDKILSRAPELMLAISSPPTRLSLPPSPCASADATARDAQDSDHALYGEVVRVDAVYSPTHAGYGRDADDEGSTDAHHTPAPPVAAPAPDDTSSRVAAAPAPITLLSPAVATAALSARSSRRPHPSPDALRTDVSGIPAIPTAFGDSGYVPTSVYTKTRRNSQLFSGLASTAAAGNPKSPEVPRNPALSVISGLSFYGGDGEEFAVHGREHHAAPATTGAEDAADEEEEGALDNGAGGVDAWETRSCGSLDRRGAPGAGEFAGVLEDSSTRVRSVQDSAPMDHVFVETLPPHLRTCLNVVTVRVRKDEYCNGLRSMLYSSAGLAIQVGATVGAVASFVAVVVLEAIPDPWFR